MIYFILNLKSEIRFCMLASRVDFSIKYKDQDISLIAKTIEKVYEILYYYLIINILIINLNFLIVQKKE